MTDFTSGFCKKGHAITPENLYVRPGGIRTCRACQSLRRERQKLKCVDCKKPVSDRVTRCNDCWAKTRIGNTYSAGYSGEEAWNWTGDNVGYHGLHSWIKKWYGKANMCVAPDCLGVSTKYEWANISGEYKRDRNDFQMMCTRCHRKMDAATRRAKKAAIHAEFAPIKREERE